MGLTLSDTELMERMGDELKEWAKKPDDALFPNTTHLPENKAFSEAGYHVTDIEALKPFNRVMECLRFYKPSVAKSVQNKYDIFMSGAYEVHQLINAGHKDPLHVSILRRAAAVLADELQHIAQNAREELATEKPATTDQNTTTAKELSKELEKPEVGTQAYPGPRRQVPTSDADRQMAFLGGYTVGEYKYAPDLPRVETERKQKTSPAKRRRIWTCVKKIPGWIYYLVGFLAALLACLYYLGWLEPVKKSIYSLLRSK